ncbi:hypothetical protein AB0K80_07220 [Streptomyces sp. NPDC052682]|uniref:hypothetical protein n=1 Tax=Streptomyces sp. NPDC052682 TaxID=3154954 RepID=UPI0034367B55
MHVSKWRENTQPEWPQAASATEKPLGENEEGASGVTQHFPDGTTDAPLLRAIPRQKEAGPDSGESLAARDPWQQQPDAGRPAQDPDEVTVQLDPVQAGAAPEGTCDGPVFVDESGRRGRRFRRAGMAVGLACAGYAAVIAATVLSGNSDAPWLPVPGQQKDEPAGQVETSPRPAEPLPPAGAPATAPGAGAGSAPTADQVTAPSRGSGAGTPGAATRPERPKASADPTVTPTRQVPKPPGTGVAVPSPTQPTTEPATQAPDPTPTDQPTTGPTESPDGGGAGGTGTVADGPATAQPVADHPAEQPDPSSSPTAPSSEYVV